jgi:hypothetical protein
VKLFAPVRNYFLDDLAVVVNPASKKLFRAFVFHSEVELSKIGLYYTRAL